MDSVSSPVAAPAAPAIRYRSDDPGVLLANPRALALFGFAPARPLPDDPRALAVHLAARSSSPVYEVWEVADTVQARRDGPLQWAEGGGWLFAAIDVADRGDMAASARSAYAQLTDFLRSRPQYHVQRLWNYLDAINQGEGDAERYRQFCAGRMDGMHGYFDDGFPAATAIGHANASGVLQLYCLAAQVPGKRVENPRQMSAWRYPRRYGPVSPSFARAMRLPAGDGLAISGTAAIQGHASQHADDLQAQLRETLTNLRSLREAGGMCQAFGARSPLKVYVRHNEDMPAVAAFLDEHIPQAPHLLLQAGVCRRELLVEIDGWHFADP